MAKKRAAKPAKRKPPKPKKSPKTAKAKKARGGNPLKNQPPEPVQSRKKPLNKSGLQIGTRERELILRWTLERRSFEEIADRLGVSSRMIGYTWRNQIAPLLRSGEMARAEVQLADLDYMSRVCWEGYHRAVSGVGREAVRDGVLAAIKEGKTSDELAGFIEESLKSIKSSESAVGWLELALKIWDRRAKLTGITPNSLHLILHHGEEQAKQFRVAGMSRDEVDREMVAKLIDRVNEEKLVNAMAMGEEADDRAGA